MGDYGVPRREISHGRFRTDMGRGIVCSSVVWR